MTEINGWRGSWSRQIRPGQAPIDTFVAERISGGTIDGIEIDIANEANSAGDGYTIAYPVEQGMVHSVPSEFNADFRWAHVVQQGSDPMKILATFPSPFTTR